MTEAAIGPSACGSVVLEIGPGVGAIVLHTPPELDGAEIEISQDAGQSGHRAAATPAQHRTHSQVRKRETATDVRYAAVYPGIAEGDYIIWKDADTPALRVRVIGGAVTTAWWPAGP